MVDKGEFSALYPGEIFGKN